MCLGILDGSKIDDGLTSILGGNFTPSCLTYKLIHKSLAANMLSLNPFALAHVLSIAHTMRVKK